MQKERKVIHAEKDAETPLEPINLSGRLCPFVLHAWRVCLDTSNSRDVWFTLCCIAGDYMVLDDDKCVCCGYDMF